MTIDNHLSTFYTYDSLLDETPQGGIQLVCRIQLRFGIENRQGKQLACGGNEMCLNHKRCVSAGLFLQQRLINNISEGK